MKKQVKPMLLLIGASFIIFTGCKKDDHPVSSCDHPGIGYNDKMQGNATSKFNADVPLAWYKLAITLTSNTPNQDLGPVSSRNYGYMGLALYESVVPGMPAHQSIQSQLNSLPALPKVKCGEKYYYPVCANASLANMVRRLFGNTSPAQNFSIDSLENVFNTLFKAAVPTHVFDRSEDFGKTISNEIYQWSKSDGGDLAYLNPFPTTYTPPVGPGLWIPLTGQMASLPYWGNNRTFIKDIAVSTQPPPPPPYSIDPSSTYYKEELEVYNESINQDPEHTTIANYWAALTPPSVSISILSSVLTIKSSNLAVLLKHIAKLV